MQVPLSLWSCLDFHFLPMLRLLYLDGTIQWNQTHSEPHVCGFTSIPNNTMLLVSFQNNIFDCASYSFFSFGMVLYKLLCRKTPHFDCPCREQLPSLICSGYRPNLHPIDVVEQTLVSADDLSIFKLLKKTILQCWVMDPMERPTSRLVLHQLNQVSTDVLMCITTSLCYQIASLEKTWGSFAPNWGEHKMTSVEICVCPWCGLATIIVEPLIAAATAWGGWLSHIAARYERVILNPLFWLRCYFLLPSYSTDGSCDFWPASGPVVSAPVSMLAGLEIDSRSGLTKTL